MTSPRIYLTGASSGIGAALAEHYAARHGQQLTLGLVARRADRLEDVAARVRAHGARALTYVADVRDREHMAAVAREFLEAAGGCTLAIANAGISRSDHLERGDATEASEVVVANVAGVIHSLMPLIPAMIAQRSGHLVTIGSVAGFRGIPGKGAYCASKAAARMLMDAWRPQLRRHGVRVTTICPGWVVSEMTDENPYPMPFLMDTARAVRLVAHAIDRGRTTYVFPWQMRLALPLIRLVPDRLLPTLGTHS